MRKPTSILLALALAAPFGLALAKDPPATNVSAKKHPNLAAAQRAALEAFSKLEDAQRANEYDLGGHAAKAKDLLRQANDEIKLAAQASNDRK
jgi:hypothetical protein